MPSGHSPRCTKWIPCNYAEQRRTNMQLACYGAEGSERKGQQAAESSRAACALVVAWVMSMNLLCADCMTVVNYLILLRLFRQLFVFFFFAFLPLYRQSCEIFCLSLLMVNNCMKCPSAVVSSQLCSSINFRAAGGKGRMHILGISVII